LLFCAVFFALSVLLPFFLHLSFIDTGIALQIERKDRLATLHLHNETMNQQLALDAIQQLELSEQMPPTPSTPVTTEARLAFLRKQRRVVFKSLALWMTDCLDRFFLWFFFLLKATTTTHSLTHSLNTHSLTTGVSWGDLIRLPSCTYTIA